MGVKVAADTAAGEIDPSRITDVTLKQLNEIAEPNDLPKDEDTRHSAEKRLLRVVGQLVEYRDEADKDYHLIITDGGKYTPGGTKTKATGHSFIAEIPSPDCIAGKKLPMNTRSQFQEQLEAVRKAFDEGPATEVGPKNEMDIPVRITGLAFFDRPHGQTGRAKNNLEIHPILNIEFLDKEAERVEIAGALLDRPRNLIEGGEFEERIAAWKTSDSDVIRTKAYPDAD